MQCCEFEMVVEYMRLKVTELGLAGRFHRTELADILMDHGVATVDRLPDVVALARRLQTIGRLAA